MVIAVRITGEVRTALQGTHGREGEVGRNVLLSRQLFSPPKVRRAYALIGYGCKEAEDSAIWGKVSI